MDTANEVAGMNKKYYDSFAIIDAITEFMEKVGNIQGADVVKVVRCKDCQWLGIKDYIYGYCRKNGLDGIVQPDDYCSRGEREEGEE